MSKPMEGPVQVLAPGAIPIVRRGLYRNGGLSSEVLGGAGVGSGAGRASPPPPFGGAPTDLSSANVVAPLLSSSFSSAHHEGRQQRQSRGSGGGLSRAVAGLLPSSSSSSSCSVPSRGPRNHNLRRIFVQTDRGAVVVVEVDCASGTGSAERVKRSVQAALNVPTEQADLVFGGQVLDDLKDLQNDVPVLLRRGITRSASSPCFLQSFPESSETSLAFGAGTRPTLPPHGGSAPAIGNSHSPLLFEVVGGVKPCPALHALMQEAMDGVIAGEEPVPATGGTGGAYYFRNVMGKSVVIVKPTDEEPFAPNNPNGYVGRSLGQPGLKHAIRVGEAGLREVAAYLLDHDAFAGVPFTALVRAAHPTFNVNEAAAPVGTAAGKSQASECGLGRFRSLGLSPTRSESCSGRLFRQGSMAPAVPSKLCSLQQYVQHDYDTSECGTSRFPVSAVHRIGILDVRVFNTDRHSGNILVRKLGQGMFERRHSNPILRVDEAVQLIPIDHGFCLPETLEAAYFEWLHWPQASLPFSDDELTYIEALDVHEEVLMLRDRLPMIREGCLRILVLSTSLLQRGAAAGLTLADIGGIMSREVRGTEEVASELEMLCLQAHKLIREEGSGGLHPEQLARCNSTWSNAAAAGAAALEGDLQCLSPGASSNGSGNEMDETSSSKEVPGLFFDFDGESGDEGDGAGEDEEADDVVSHLASPTLQGGADGACFSPKWSSSRRKVGRPGRDTLQGPSGRLAIRLDFNDPAQPPRPSAPTNLLRGDIGGVPGAGGVSDGTPAKNSPLAGVGSNSTGMMVPPPAKLVLPGARASPCKMPCRHESLTLKRFKQTGGVVPAPPPLSPGPPPASGLKVGSAGVLGRRLKASSSHSVEQDVDGLLPGGASFRLSDMSESEWERFYEVYLNLVEDLVTHRAALRSYRRADLLGTSCQW